MKRILVVIAVLTASAAFAGEPSAQYIDQVSDPPRPPSDKTHSRSIKEVRKANYVPYWKLRYEIPEEAPPYNFRSIGAQSRKGPSRVRR